MLICFEPSQTDAPKRAGTVNALSGYDRVLTLLKTWQVLFGLVASEIYPAAFYAVNRCSLQFKWRLRQDQVIRLLSVRLLRFMIGVGFNLRWFLFYTKKKDVSKMRRLKIESFFNAQTSMEIFGGELVGLFSILADVSHFNIKRLAQSI